MSRPKNAVPQPRQHKGRAVLDVYENGTRRTRTLGAWGSPEADAEYKRFLAEFATGAHDRPSGPDITVNEVLAAFLTHAHGHYRRADGTQTHEVDEYKLVARLVRETYGHTLAREFGPLALKAVRQAMIDRQWCRALVNQRVNRVRRMFKWCASEELIAFDVYQRLTAVTGLQKGRSAVREAEPVGPVADAVVDATLPHLNRFVRGLVQFQRLTGCRPGEACQVRRCDIDTSAPVWRYKPVQHKTGWRGKARVIPVGPLAQAVLNLFPTDSPDEYVFSPRRAVEEFHAARASARHTPRFASHMAHNKARRSKSPTRPPAEAYTTLSYGKCIARACDLAFPAPAPLAKRPDETLAEWDARLTAEQKAELAAWQSKHRWYPNRLRHTFGTRVRKGHGLEAVQALLGHAHANVTEIYAERNIDLAVSVAAKIG
jgi:integrase